MPIDLAAYQQSLAALGTRKIAHLDGDLLSHMTNVYRYLARMKRPESVMLAGLCHGIYGTHALQDHQVFELPGGRREDIRALIGQDAERLVYLFCAMTYESLGKSIRKLLKPNGIPELWDRCTGCPMPATRQELENLLWIKLADLLAHLPQLSEADRREVVADYAPIWQLVAEQLGPDAIGVWNENFEESLRIEIRAG